MAEHVSAEKGLREVWGIQHPPSVHVEREYPELRWAVKQMDYQDRPSILVHRFVSEWETCVIPSAETAEGSSDV